MTDIYQRGQGELYNTKLLTDDQAFAEWQKANQQAFHANYQAKALEAVSEWLTEAPYRSQSRPDVIAQIADPEKRKQAEDYHKALEQRFHEKARRYNDADPKQATRVILEDLEREIAFAALADREKGKDAEIASMQEELASAKKEIEQLNAQITTKRKIADVHANKGVATPSPAKPPPARLSTNGRASLEESFRRWNP